MKRSKMLTIEELKRNWFKFVVKGDHPVFRRVDRRCYTLSEAENVRRGLEVVGYEVTIEEI